MKEKKNIEFIFNSQVTRIIGNNKLEKIEITDKSNKTKEINVNGLFIAIVKIPENENFKDIIELNEDGYIITDENCRTNIKGIFAAGDNRNKVLRQLVTATSDGAIAASEAIKYIEK